MNDNEIRDCIDVSIRDEVFESVRSIYHAQYTQLNEIEIISVKEDEVRIKMPLKGKLNSIGFAHGGAVFTVADNAFAFAANLRNEKQIALSGNIVYHRPGAGDELIAVTEKISDTNSVSTYSVKVYCNNKHIATAMFTGFKIKDRKQ
ncbi:MAG: PaaI family thioesterase [Methanomassiliicoccaceae archaeon]|nr:PaaI family thioesterase [Methanomassiliicoccaceae archaeon]